MKRKSLWAYSILAFIPIFFLAQACVEGEGVAPNQSQKKYQLPRKVDIEAKMKLEKQDFNSQMKMVFSNLKDFLSKNLKLENVKDNLGMREAKPIEGMTVDLAESYNNEDYSYNLIKNEFKFNYKGLELFNETFSDGKSDFLNFIVGLPVFIELDGISDNNPNQVREIKKTYGDNVFNFHQCFFNSAYNEFVDKERFSILSPYFYLGYYLGHSDGANLDQTKGELDGVVSYCDLRISEAKNKDLPKKCKHAFSFGYAISKNKNFQKLTAKELKVVFRKIIFENLQRLSEDSLDYYNLVDKNKFSLSSPSYFIYSTGDESLELFNKIEQEVSDFHTFWSLENHDLMDRVVLDVDQVIVNNNLNTCAKSDKFNEAYYIFNPDKAKEIFEKEQSSLLIFDVARKYVSDLRYKEKDLAKKAIGQDADKPRFYEKGTSVKDIRYDNRQVDEYIEADFICGFYSMHKNGKGMNGDAVEEASCALMEMPYTIRLNRFKNNRFNTKKVLFSNADVKSRFEVRGEYRARFFKLGAALALDPKFKNINSESFEKLHKVFVEEYKKVLVFPLINHVRHCL